MRWRDPFQTIRGLLLAGFVVLSLMIVVAGMLGVDPPTDELVDAARLAVADLVGGDVWPPRPLQPLVERPERKFAHSLKFVLPRMTAPASSSERNRSALVCRQA